MFWDKFIELCANKGISPNAVAKELSISSGAVTKWKNGAVPQNSKLKLIADYFGVTTEYFFINHNESEIKNNTLDIAEQIKKYLEEQKLSEAEKSLIDLFRLIPENQQQLVIQMIRAALGR